MVPLVFASPSILEVTRLLPPGRRGDAAAREDAAHWDELAARLLKYAPSAPVTRDQCPAAPCPLDLSVARACRVYPARICRRVRRRRCQVERLAISTPGLASLKRELAAWAAHGRQS